MDHLEQAKQHSCSDAPLWKVIPKRSPLSMNGLSLGHLKRNPTPNFLIIIVYYSFTCSRQRYVCIIFCRKVFLRLTLCFCCFFFLFYFLCCHFFLLLLRVHTFFFCFCLLIFSHYYYYYLIFVIILLHFFRQQNTKWPEWCLDKPKFTPKWNCLSLFISPLITLK